LLPDRVVMALRDGPAPVSAYVYDRATLLDRVALVRSSLPPGAALLYAVKANGHPDLLAAVAPAVDGFEVASGGELSRALAAGAGSIMFAGPAKTDVELRAAIRAGATVNVESEFELRRLSLLAVAAGASAEVGLRVNRPVPFTADVTHRMIGEPTQFGISEVDLPALVDLVSRLPGVRLRGLHLHAMSNNLDADAHVAFVTDALDWAVSTGLDLDYLNVGGGFGIDYLRSRSFDVALLKSIVIPAGLCLVFEPGRFLAAPAGWYAAEVLDLKRSHGRWFAVVRGGTHHFRLPAAWGYSHPFTILPVDGWPYPFTRPVVEGVEVDVAGELCTPRDILARGAWVDRLRVGDLLVFADTGAYGWEISHRDFLDHPYPAMIVL